MIDILKNFYQIKIKECELLIDVYDKLFHLATQMKDDDLAQDYSEDVSYYIKRKKYGIDELEGKN